MSIEDSANCPQVYGVVHLMLFYSASASLLPPYVITDGRCNNVSTHDAVAYVQNT